MTRAEYQKSEKGRAVRTAYRQSEKGRAAKREQARRLRALDPEKARAKDRAYAKANPGYVWCNRLRYHYKLTITKWLAIFDGQQCRCAICGTTKPGKRGWATDHDHETGRVRGILCPSCNLRLGWLGDNAAEIELRITRLRCYFTGAAAHERKAA